MDLVFLIIASVTLMSAIAAMTLRNLVHCALCMVLAFAGIAAIYLQLNAQFVGFAQILVYVGAVAILIVFAVLLTRGTDTEPGFRVVSRSWISAVVIAAGVFAALRYGILSSTKLARTATEAAPVTVKQIGEQLMTKYVLPLEAIGLLLTAAMIGAVIISMRDKETNTDSNEENKHTAEPTSSSTASPTLHHATSIKEP
jgi:NADH-quinone oxidoreductase subunit J